MHAAVVEYVDRAATNGIMQHSDQWLEIRKYTVGGSSISTILGLNPYESMVSLVRKRLGWDKFADNISPQWGNLFEDVIKRVVEYQKNTLVLGEDLYIDGGERRPYTSYSPDGIAVINDEIVLLEFKCPYSRIPDGKVPKYYVPQVLMGLDLMQLPTRGLFVEAVFRRCAWENLGYNSVYDTTLVPESSGTLPLAFGILGFYATGEHVSELPAVIAAFNYFGELGDNTNGYMVNDLGTTPLALFSTLMQAVDSGKIHAYYGKILHTIGDNPIDVQNQVQLMHDELDAYMAFCENKASESGSLINIGMLPWKMFRIDYNYINPIADYVKPHLPTIKNLCEFLQKCNDPNNAGKRMGMYESFIATCAT